MIEGGLTLTDRLMVPLEEGTQCVGKGCFWLVQPLLMYPLYLALHSTKQKPLLSFLGSHCLILTRSKFAICRSYNLQLLLRRLHGRIHMCLLLGEFILLLIENHN